MLPASGIGRGLKDLRHLRIMGWARCLSLWMFVLCKVNTNHVYSSFFFSFSLLHSSNRRPTLNFSTENGVNVASESKNDGMELI